MPVEEKTELDRNLGALAVFTTTAGTMIGAGIFILPGPAAEAAGPAASLSFAIAGAIALISTMCAVELATAMPKAGGSYFFVSRAQGPLVATIVGLGAWISLVFKGSFALAGLSSYLNIFWPISPLIVALVGGVLLVFLNLFGSEKSGFLQNLVVFALILILGVLIVKGVFGLNTQNLSPFIEFGVQGVVSTTGLVFISYLGVIKATAVAGEVKEPGKNLPKGMFGAVLFVTFLYVAIMLVVTGLLPIEAIKATTTPVADAGEILFGGVGGTVLALAGIFATTSTANAAILSSSRFPYAMAEDGLMSKKLSKLSNKYRTPMRAILLTGAIMIVLVFVFDTNQLSKLGGTFGILVFALLNLSVILLRAADPEWYKPKYKVPLSPYLPFLGAVAALLLVPFMGLLSQVSAILFILAGAAWYSYRRTNEVEIKPEHDIGDQLQRVEYKKSLEDKEKKLSHELLKKKNKIVVEVEENTSNEFLDIAAAFANKINAKLEILLITECPTPIPLCKMKTEPKPEILGYIEKELENKVEEIEFDHILTRNRTHALLEKVDEDTELVLVDWEDPIKLHRVFETHVDELLEKELDTRVAALKHRRTEGLDEIVVAANRGPYDRAEVEMADTIAQATGASLSLVMTVPESTSSEEENMVKSYLKDLKKLLNSDSEIEIIKDNDTVKSIINRANNSGLVLLGAPTHTSKLYDFIGQRTEKIAAKTKASVLVVKDPLEKRSLFRKILRKLISKKQEREQKKQINK